MTLLYRVNTSGSLVVIEDWEMAPDVVVQVSVLILTLSMVFTIHRLIKQGDRRRFRNKKRDTQLLNRHLAQATHHLTRAQSIPFRNQSETHARNAIREAIEALSFSPKDPTAHIIKAMASDLMGHHAAALKSLDVALSSPSVKSLSEKELMEALVKRAELKWLVNRKRRVDSAIDDLTRAVKLSDCSECESKSKAFCILGQCYEWKGLKEKAEEAFKWALEIEPEYIEALNGLGRIAASR